MMASRSAALSDRLLALAGSGVVARREPPSVVEAGILELQLALQEGRVTSAWLVDAYLARIRAYDQDGPCLNAIIRLNPRAGIEAEALDLERREAGPRGPLHGIPILLKDNYDVEGMATSAGSLGLATLVPPDDAFQVRTLRAAGAIILGKTNLHELAAGITTISSLGGQTRNPYDPARNPGGSSGGTGAAIAASFAAVGWGTDTSGSIRIPAAHQALFGLRPTKGLSSTDGVVPLCHSQDVAGPLARMVTDLAIALDATIGPDPADPATRATEGRPPVGFVEALAADALRGRRIGVLGQRFGRRKAEQEVNGIVRSALDAVKGLGADVIDIEIAGLDSQLDTSSLIRHEFKFDLADYLAAIPGAPVHSLREIIALGLYHEALEQRFRERDRPESRDTDEYRAALADQDRLRRLLLEAFARHRLDAIAYPTVMRPPARIDEPQDASNCQISAHTGLPALSAPVGFTQHGLPVGIELLGRPFQDARLVAMAYAYEQSAMPRRPPPTTPELVLGRRPEPAVLHLQLDTSAGADTIPDGMIAQASLRFDPSTSTLDYAVVLCGVDAEEVLAIALSRGTDGADGPALHRLSGPGLAVASGACVLPGSHVADLRGGRLSLRVFTRARPHGALRARIRID